MADKKITELPELTAVAADDYLEIVDTSTNTNKKISRETLTNFAWQDWTPTGVGWIDGTLTGTFLYSQVGKLVYCIIAITAGTSNDNKAEISLPVTPSFRNWIVRGTWGWGMDNGVQVSPAGGWVLNTTDNTIRFFKTSIDGMGWTASGTKRIYCQFFYEAA